MSDFGDNQKYKWAPESTALLVSIWSDKQVQKQFEYVTKAQLIWESVSRYMKKKGYNVSAKQCRSRMKQVLVCYREAKRAGTRAGVEQYYEIIDRVLKSKRVENNVIGIDTVDAAVSVESPSKDIKTNKNLQVRHKFQEPAQSLYRSEALSPTWTLTRENEYPDSPESNETVIARPYTMFSPKKDVAINTGDQFSQIPMKTMQCNTFLMEEPLCMNYKQNLMTSYPYGDIPFQNTVQNVQNQIIQENMQQHHNVVENRTWNQLPMQNSIPNNQNQLQQNAPINSHAMPQEPQKMIFAQNLRPTCKPDTCYMSTTMGPNQNESLSSNFSPEVSQNLNDAFCQSSKNEDKTHNLNETFNQPVSMLKSDISMVTNNATCNDDSILLEFLLESPTPSESETKCRNTVVNTNEIPNAPVRKKKGQKLEQLVLNAINSQNEVVNKILSAQNDMVSKFLDIDRDRQDRLENRLDHLLKVVHATVLKNPETESAAQQLPQEPIIMSMVPPPKPGAIPPKLDLVPPKPCRVPCTIANSNVELINQNPVCTRPGIVSPITSPSKKPGTIWSKLGPVSQSPFVKAQQRLGLQPICNTEVRTQSSAERRIARENDRISMDICNMIFETKKFLEMEQQLDEKVENARIEMHMEQNLSARRRLFTQREPTAAMILSAAFIEAECQAAGQDMDYYEASGKKQGALNKIPDDDLLAGQGESYERLRQLNIRPTYIPPEPSDSSTPAKLLTNINNNGRSVVDPQKQTIRQLTQLVMNSARWKDIAASNQPRPLMPTIQTDAQINHNILSSNVGIPIRPQRTNNVPYVQTNNTEQERSDRNKILAWSQSKGIHSVTTENQKPSHIVPRNDLPPPKPKFPVGFTTAMLDGNRAKQETKSPEYSKSIECSDNVLRDNKPNNVRFMDEALAELQRMYNERLYNEQQEKNDNLPYIINNGNGVSPQSRQMIEKYVREMIPRELKDGRDKETDSDNDEEFLDTTGTMSQAIIPHRGSLTTSTGTMSTETAHTMRFGKDHNNCIIS
ncbi:hypothetical protein KM043_011278 [Ampulex compressa]|nr:hypothetical protein KM043_011278 [Ampulex compressa]